MRIKRKKTNNAVEPLRPLNKEKVRSIHLVQSPAPTKQANEKLVRYVVKQPEPLQEDEEKLVHYVIKPPAPSKSQQKPGIIKLVSVPGHIMRALQGSSVARENLSEAVAEKLVSIRNADDLAKSILRFLINHADRGFTASEICTAVEGVGRNKVRLLLAGLGVEYRRCGKVLFSINPPETQTSRTMEMCQVALTVKG